VAIKPELKATLQTDVAGLADPQHAPASVEAADATH